MTCCPKCNSSETMVKDSRAVFRDNKAITKRRRLCLICANRYVTLEILEQDIDPRTKRDRSSKIDKLNVLLNDLNKMLVESNLLKQK